MVMIRSVRAALALIGPARRRKLVGVAALGLIVSLLEAASAVVVLVLMRLILEPEGALLLPLLGDVRGLVPSDTHAQLVTWLAAAFSVFFVVRAGVFLFQRYALARVVENTGVVLADELVRGYLEMPYEEHLRRNTAELVRNAYDNVQQAVANVFTPIVQVLADTVLVAVMMVVLLVASPGLTLVAGVVIAGTMIVTLQIVQPRLRAAGVQRQLAAKRALEDLQQGFGGVRDIKLHGGEEVFTRRFRRARTDMARAQYVRVVLSYVPRVAIETVFLVVIVGSLVWATRSGSVGTTLSTLGVFAYVGMRLQPIVQKIAGALNSLRFSSAVVEDLRHDLALPAGLQARVEETAGQPMEFKATLHLERVSFEHVGADGARTPILHEIELTVDRGERIGIVGTTGSGKSTLLDLVAGLLKPTAGAIRVDGRDISTATRAWQAKIGFVQQTPFLWDASLRENIALGVARNDIDDHRLGEVVAAAQLEGLMADLPAGLDTPVGQLGNRLSGGQRQRVVLARAMYRQPELLLLDEGTSALDRMTEQAVLRALHQMAPTTTVMMVAHRLASLAGCDRIVHLEEGRIARIETWAEMQTSGNRPVLAP